MTDPEADVDFELAVIVATELATTIAERCAGCEGPEG